MTKRVRCVAIVLMAVLSVLTVWAQGPPAPQNLTVNSGPLGGAVLEWSPSMMAMGYRLYKSVDGSEFFQIAGTPMTRFFDWAIYPFHEYRYFVAAVGAEAQGPSSDTVRYSITPAPPSGAFGIVHGSVQDSGTGLPIREAVVRFFRPGRMWEQAIHTDSSGNYAVRLDTGKYLALAEKFGFLPKWYDDVYFLRDASFITLHQDSTGYRDTVSANFNLRRIAPPPGVIASGIVSDTAGHSLRGTFVAYLRPHRVLRQLSRMSEFFAGFPFERLTVPGFGVLNGVVWAGFTDSTGQYSAHVFAGERHVALAFKPGFVPQFFKDKLTPFDADRIVISNDSSGFDFTLYPNPFAVGRIYGTVVDSAGEGIPAHVMLLRLTPAGPLLVRYQPTDSLGDYEFTKLVPGRFIVRSIPVDGFAPAWYSSTSCGVRNWHNATIINLVAAESAVVCVKPLLDFGFGRITGSIGGSSQTSGPAASLGGVSVEAVSMTTGQVIGYDVTEDDGSYAIENLPGGEYQIVVDKEGYTPQSSPSVTIDQTNGYETSGGTITITADPPTAVGNGPVQIPVQYSLGQNYPNPFNPTTTMKFGLPQASLVSIRVFNLIGEEVATLLDGAVPAGEHIVRWNGQDGTGKAAATGVYFLRFFASSVSGGGEGFLQVRKMVLMK